jgi:hypothetical protein
MGAQTRLARRQLTLTGLDQAQEAGFREDGHVTIIACLILW